jgi:chorismate mutase
LNPDLTRAFFAAQVEAAKKIQRADFARWAADPHGPERKAPDLAGALRPRIDALNRELLDALARAKPDLLERNGPERLRERAGQILVGEGVDATVRATAIGPLLAVRVFEAWTPDRRNTSSTGSMSSRPALSSPPRAGP